MTSPSRAPHSDTPRSDIQADAEAETIARTTPKAAPVVKPTPLPPEIGGAKGPEPTRYGDWEHKGRCTDF